MVGNHIHEMLVGLVLSKFNNPNLSERTVAYKVVTSVSTVHRTKGRPALRSFNIQKVPDRIEEKDIVAKTRV